MIGTESSPAVRALWAKTSRDNDSQWLPLVVHMADAAGMAQRLWKRWLSHGTRTRIARGLGLPVTEAGRLAVVLAGAHDLGKATPGFQQRAEHLVGLVAECGLPVTKVVDAARIPHAHVSQAILAASGVDSTLGIVASGHHGQPPNQEEMKQVDSYPRHTGLENPAWIVVQETLTRYAAELGGMEVAALKGLTADVPSQVLLSALVTMADWLASDEELFPYYEVQDGFSPADADSDARVAHAWKMAALPSPWDTALTALDRRAFLQRFSANFDPRPLQEAVLAHFPNIDQPGITLIEAPMGEGKTEAALAAAEIFAGKTGRSGVYFALPTQATSDGLFPRFKTWMQQLVPGEGDAARDLLLAHGKSRFNEEYQGLPVRHVRIEADGGAYDDTDGDSDGGVVAHAWFHGRRKAMLSGFVVGTIDQVLLAGLRQKHQALRHLGLANKVIVIDECHAYDAYMSQYLGKVLRWLGAYGVPVIVLSATLPSERRQNLVQEYMGGSAATETADAPYPRITYSDGGELHSLPVSPSARKLSVELESLPDEALVDRVAAVLDGGGCAGIVVNTVGRAQALWKDLAGRLGPDVVRLLHSRFLACDRATKEAEVRALLGRPGASGGLARPERLVVVGTQVMEQSLDVDFDVLFTDLCPMDLLIQRIGRLHRHARPRPPGLEAARCFVMGTADGPVFDSASNVYGEWPLLTARTILSQRRTMTLPDDIAALVDVAYAPEGVEPPPGEEERFEGAWRKLEDHKNDQCARAKLFQIKPPPRAESRSFRDLTGWLAAGKKDAGDANGKQAEAAVRDTDPSLEVLVIEERPDGTFGLLPWIGDGASLSAGALEDGAAALVAGCSVRLPRALAAPWNLNRTIQELEKDNMHRIPPAWQASPWLRGELILAMACEGEAWVARVGGYRLEYTRAGGLAAMREETET